MGHRAGRANAHSRHPEEIVRTLKKAGRAWASRIDSLAHHSWSVRAVSSSSDAHTVDRLARCKRSSEQPREEEPTDDCSREWTLASALACVCAYHPDIATLPTRKGRRTRVQAIEENPAAEGWRSERTGSTALTIGWTVLEKMKGRKSTHRTRCTQAVQRRKVETRVCVHASRRVMSAASSCAAVPWPHGETGY